MIVHLNNLLHNTCSAPANSVPIRNWQIMCNDGTRCTCCPWTDPSVGWESLLPFVQFSDSGVIKPAPHTCMTRFPPSLPSHSSLIHHAEPCIHSCGHPGPSSVCKHLLTALCWLPQSLHTSAVQSKWEDGCRRRAASKPQEHRTPESQLRVLYVI